MVYKNNTKKRWKGSSKILMSNVHFFNFYFDPTSMLLDGHFGHTCWQS